MKEVLGVKLYTLEEVGQLLGVRKTAITKYLNEGTLKARTIGGQKYVSEASLKSFVMND